MHWRNRRAKAFSHLAAWVAMGLPLALVVLVGVTFICYRDSRGPADAALLAILLGGGATRW